MEKYLDGRNDWTPASTLSFDLRCVLVVLKAALATEGGKNAALASGKFVPLLNRIWPIAVDLEFNGPAVPSAGAAAREPSLLSLLLGTIQNYICGSIEAKKR